MRRFAALVPFVALSLALSQTPATLDLSTYALELDRIVDQISSAASPQDASPIAAAVPDYWRVAVDDQLLVVEAGWIDAEVHSAIRAPHRWPAARRAIVQRLEMMREEASVSRSAPGTTPDDVLAAVRARPEFQRHLQNRWFDELQARILSWIEDLLSRVSGGPVSARSVATVLAWGLSIAALLALTLWVVSVLTRRARAASLGLENAAVTRTPGREWALRAIAALRAGEAREAVRCAYEAALSRIEEQGVWRVDASRTPREYLPLLGGDDPRRPALTALTRDFERVWYGGRLPGADSLRQLPSHLEHLGCLREHDLAT